jgi:predicted transcriptional regulator of viral defense system
VETSTLTALLSVAAEHGGYIATRDAAELGIPAARLVTLARRGAVEHIGHGLYRLSEYPPDPHDDLIRAVLWANRRGAISHETALGFYEIADVNPIAVDVSVPLSYRISRAGGERYRVHRVNLPPDQVTNVDGVRVVVIARAIHDSIDQGVGSALIKQAIDTSRSRGWITKEQSIGCTKALEAAIHGK